MLTSGLPVVYVPNINIISRNITRLVLARIGLDTNQTNRSFITENFEM